MEGRHGRLHPVVGVMKNTGTEVVPEPVSECEGGDLNPYGSYPASTSSYLGRSEQHDSCGSRNAPRQEASGNVAKIQIAVPGTTSQKTDRRRSGPGGHWSESGQDWAARTSWRTLRFRRVSWGWFERRRVA